MRLLSLFKRKPDADKAPAKLPSADDVERARTRARRRLLGAIVLLGVGVIAFPLLFETQPRPVPVDLPIEIPRRESAPPLAVPPPRRETQASGVVTDATAGGRAAEGGAPTESAGTPGARPPAASAGDAGERAAAQRRSDAEGAAVPRPAAPRTAEPAAADKPAADAGRPAGKQPAASAEAERARALLEGQAVAGDAGRYAVQVGAYADAALARQMRAKVEKLGLKAYTQVVSTSAGRRVRVRVGPFDSRDEADKVAGKIKAAGLPSAIVTL